MSEANSGSAILAGNPASDGAAGNGATAPVTNAPADTGAPANAPATGNWYDSIEDNDLKGYAQNKGWKDPVEVLNGYRNLEKLVGSEKVPLPKGAEDKDGWNRVYDALGRPKTAEEYKLPLPEGQGPTEFTKSAAAKFHELGLSNQQAENLAGWFNEQQAGQMNNFQTQTAAKAEADLTGLKTEWGGAYDENIQMAKVAVREYGLDATKLTAIENALGTGEMMKLFAKIGRAQGEHKFEAGNGANSFGMTPAAAQQRIAALREDREWSSKYIGGNADARAEMDKLMKLAYPDQ